MANTIDPLTLLPATDLAGRLTFADTSAIGEIAVVCVAESGSVFGPWLVAVEIVAVADTAPLDGAVNAMPTVMLAPAPSDDGMFENTTAPLALLYVAVAAGGTPVITTLLKPGGRPIA